MISLLEIASIVFVCVAANHLGLVAAIEEKTKHRIPVVNCPKCFTFWSVVTYSTWSAFFGKCQCLLCCKTIAAIISGIPIIIAISFLAAWSAIWVELAMGFIDQLYIKAYGKIYSTADSTDTNEATACDTMSDMQ